MDSKKGVLWQCTLELEPTWSLEMPVDGLEQETGKLV